MSSLNIKKEKNIVGVNRNTKCIFSELQHARAPQLDCVNPVSFKFRLEVEGLTLAIEIAETLFAPRLGPKPFTPPNLADTENTFSKVFSVPAVPGQTTTSISQEKDKSPTVEEVTEKTEAVNGKSDENHTKSDVGNGKSASSGEEEASSDSGYVPRTPSTAERRKLFETKPNSKENDPEELDSVDFERGSLQRASIAERRKMYENRSISVQEQGLEKKENSPVMMRRKDSFKNRKNAEDVLKDDNNRKSMPIAKQQSLDPVGVRKSEVSMPTPKRTSTVFVPVHRVHRFKYLGYTVNDKWDPEVEIKIRIEIARSTFIKMRKLLSNRNLSINLRWRATKCYVLSTLLYGVEGWTLTAATIKKVTNTEVLRRMGKEVELLTTVKRRKASYLGHVFRNEKYSLLQLIVEGKIESRRGLGRRKKSWLRNLREWFQIPKAANIIHAAQKQRNLSYDGRQPSVEDGT
ncbi:unnamed protein product [Diabrotica balteata]|uniref:Uncharacterized protein n=1 Tax=Diabrotica balteata TaxID=107213 RepID=A0A9N9XA57_DIABA|nr:unnamed protein product [Diabrotica balteata]